ncbi:MAG: endo-1,3-alpha-glucanase family glycosylhydrolase, partial [Victivallaceae bacterium]|nr:endo-1,3-alpha-glucanase family glycosylhydrolase [Victivallaceae bacterium]
MKIKLVLILSFTVMMLGGTDLTGKKWVFSHYTAWHSPLISSMEQLLYYHYPLLRSTGERVADYRREIELAKSMAIDGFIVDIVHKPGVIPSNYVYHMVLLLEAARGLDFSVCPALDVKTNVPKQVSELVKLLKQSAEHPNYPHIDGRPVVFSYSCINGGRVSWTAEEFREIRQG